MSNTARNAVPPVLAWCLLMVAAVPRTAMAQTVVKIEGTPASYQTLVAISEAHAKVAPDRPVEVLYGGSGAGIRKLAKGAIDIAVVEYPHRKYVDAAWARAFPKDAVPPTEPPTPDRTQEALKPHDHPAAEIKFPISNRWF